MTEIDGVPFECTMCGKCCRWEGVVDLTPEDMKKLAHHLNIPLGEFIEEYTEAGSLGRILKNRKGMKDCVFLKDNKCEVYEARPQQCVTFPEKYDANCPGFQKNPVKKEGAHMSRYEEAVQKMNEKFSSVQDNYERAIQNNLYADLQKGVKTASVSAQAVEDGIDGFFDTNRVKVASLDDLFAFNRVDDKHLIHKSTKDLWTIEADKSGDVHIARLFDDNGDPIKG